MRNTPTTTFLRVLTSLGLSWFEAVVDRRREISEDDIRPSCLPHTEAPTEHFVVEELFESLVVKSSDI